MRYNKCDVAGCVILYNSQSQVIENIHSYLIQINHLFVIDNSEVINYSLLENIKEISGITYIHNGDNLGVAYALNRAANMATTAGYQFLLTMDDDTYFPVGGIQKMLEYANQHGIEKLGILAAQSDVKLFSDTIKQVSYTITSGNLLNLSAYKKCGPFANKLFIDFVDHEYCFRLKQCGYAILELNTIRMKHSLGRKKQVTILCAKFPLFWVSHSPSRIYYKTRNCIFTLREYNFIESKIIYIFCKEIFKDFLKVLFLEDEKKKRIVLFLEGFYDGFSGNLGKKEF